MAVSLEEGDEVEVVLREGKTVRGRVEEVRGGGWFAVQYQVGSGFDVGKFRARQLQPLSTTSLSSRSDGHTASKTRSATTPPPVAEAAIELERASEASLRTDMVEQIRMQPPPLIDSKPLETALPFLEKDTRPLSTALPFLDLPDAPPPPTMIDLDGAVEEMDMVERQTDREYLRQVANHASYDKWVVFSDLHCATSTLETCLQVLDTVHAEAVKRKAGVLFLGDWWHHRGTIRVNILNAVLEALQTWTVPLVMIPGNHDQITLGGQDHGLTPLEHAFRIDCPDGSTVPGPLIFSHPTTFRQGLFVPHIRDVATMESVLRSPDSLAAQALFVHADVTGASMNDLIVSQGGVSPAVFPPHKPIYSGHFHKQHVVTSPTTGSKIEYIGSPYETSLSEAHQDKFMFVLNDKWECIERMPMTIGRRHFRLFGINDFISSASLEGGNEKCNIGTTTKTLPHGAETNTASTIRTGDRVVVTVDKEALELHRRTAVNGDLCDFDARTKSLRKLGVSVEIHETKAAAEDPVGIGEADSKSQLEELTLDATWSAFLDEEVRRDLMTRETSQQLLSKGLALLDEVELQGVGPSVEQQRNTTTELLLESVDLQGFGPFRDSVTYPLQDRGLVLVRGSNHDGGSDR